jgi:tRNA G18 (ribose-2'-O)-methylase SpoU
MKLQKNNVLSRFKGLEVEEIKGTIKRYPVGLGSYCVQYDINIGSLIRNSNAFACSHFVMVGKKKWDRRSSIGMQNYENLVHCENWDALLKFLRAQNYTLVGVDWVENVSLPISKIEKYPDNTFFLMGSERFGLPQHILEECDMVVHINQFGCVRSLNVAVASGIILNDWHNKNG